MSHKPIFAGAALFALAALPSLANAGGGGPPPSFPAPGQGPPTCAGEEGPPAGAPGQAVFGPNGFGPPGQTGAAQTRGPFVPYLLGEEFGCGIGPFGGGPNG